MMVLCELYTLTLWHVLEMYFRLSYLLGFLGYSHCQVYIEYQKIEPGLLPFQIFKFPTYLWPAPGSSPHHTHTGECAVVHTPGEIEGKSVPRWPTQSAKKDNKFLQFPLPPNDFLKVGFNIHSGPSLISSFLILLLLSSLLYNSFLCLPFLFGLLDDPSLPSIIFRFYVETEVSPYLTLSEIFTHGYEQIR